jgi:hypothetical protein
MDIVELNRASDRLLEYSVLLAPDAQWLEAIPAVPDGLLWYHREIVIDNVPHEYMKASMRPYVVHDGAAYTWRAGAAFRVSAAGLDLPAEVIAELREDSLAFKQLYVQAGHVAALDVHTRDWLIERQCIVLGIVGYERRHLAAV